MKLFETIKHRREQRKEYIIVPKVTAEKDTRIYAFTFLPTIVWQPWRYRYPNSFVVELWWLNFVVGIGWWERRKDNAAD